MRAAILAIGALYWEGTAKEDRSGTAPHPREKWRRERLNMAEAVHVKVPIRYGRRSQTWGGCFTMTFRGNDQPGNAFLVPCRGSIDNIDDLLSEATALWKAEMPNADANAIASETGCVGLLFADSNSDLRQKWVEHFSRNGPRRLPFGARADGLLTIPWPEAVDDPWPGAVDNRTASRFEVILATALTPEPTTPSADDIAEAWIRDEQGHEKYFFNNVNAGIRTPEDLDIWARIERAHPPWLGRDHYQPAIRILNDESARVLRDSGGDTATDARESAPRRASAVVAPDKDAANRQARIQSSAPMRPAAETRLAPRQAILVIHGIGQQQPFQALDSFVNGLRATLQRDQKKVVTTHRMFGREEVFDHAIRIEVSDPNNDAQSTLRLDVYEFYWASLTQGKASFTQVVRWLAITGFTPVRRFAFNLPLLTRHGQSWARLCLQFIRELWRLVYVPLAAAGVAWLAANLVGQSSELVKKLPDALAQALPDLATWAGASAAAFALVSAMAAVGLGLSIPEQVRDLVRLRRQKRGGPVEEAFKKARLVYNAELNFVTGLLKGVVAGAQSLKRDMDEREQLQSELRARLWFLPLSFIGFVFAAAILIWLCLPSPFCVGPVCPVPVVHDLLFKVVTPQLVSVLLVLGIALTIKRVSVDYLADVALYTTADENSAFFATRANILKEATRRLRFLLRNREYASVAIAGHSLGSVIAYDAINWLRTEAQLPRIVGAREALNELAELTKRLPAEHVTAAKVALDRLERAANGGAIEPKGGAGGRSEGALTAPIAPDDLTKLRTLITFGSPLNKVLYFFRTKVKVYETIRGHIIQELYGFRQLPDLLTRDPTIRDLTESPPDTLYWLNVYSPMDPVSARLVFYDRVDERRHWYLLWGKCHVNYWHDGKFYEEVLAALDAHARRGVGRDRASRRPRTADQAPTRPVA